MLGALSTAGGDLAGLVPAAMLQRLFLGVAIVVSLVVLAAIGKPVEWYRRATDRLVGGVPWGTLLVMAGLVAVYGGLQDGFGTAEPIVLPFRAWSYLDPRGLLLAGFAHANTSHLVGNLIGTLVFGSAAEYIWGHYTIRRDDTFAHELWTHPVVRAVVVFPAIAAVLAVGGTALALGPIIGFSMVVFVFAGFTLVRYPLVAVVAGVGQETISRLVNAIQQPETVTGAASGATGPWFASIAIQAHAVGLLIGVLLGLAYYRLGGGPTGGISYGEPATSSNAATSGSLAAAFADSDDTANDLSADDGSRPDGGLRTTRSLPSAQRLWLGVLLFGMARSLWAVYWYRGAESYVLYRAIGVGLVFLLAALVTYAVIARDEPLVPGLAVPNPQTMLADMTTISHRQVALLLVIAASSFLVSPAIAANATTIADADLPGEAVEVRGYELTYGENVTDGQINVFDIRGFGETTRVNTSGVIVRNTDRHIWSTAVSRGELAVSGSAAVRLGGIGWQETVTATREEWRAVGGDTTYRVSLTHNNTTRPLYTSPAATAEPVVAGQRITLNATDGGFRLTVGDETAPIPTQGNVTTLNGIQFSREDDRLVAIHDRTDTAVRVATKVN
jgi:membrane associated rhomboid family serine protease